MQCLTKTNISNINIYYKAVRIYNLGFINPINLGASSSNYYYTLDIANCLIS
jgi:hypothetical protein